MVMMRDLYGYGTVIDYLMGFYSPADRFDDDSSDLISALEFCAIEPGISKSLYPP